MPDLPAQLLPMQSRAWFSASIEEFLKVTPAQVIGELTTHSTHAVDLAQRDAWLREIELLHGDLCGHDGHLFLEFSIPRMGRRVDAVVIIGAVVFAVEFKIGERAFTSAGREQVWDYALDLKNFHEGSHAAAIVPVLIATESEEPLALKLQADADGVYHPVLVGRDGMRDVLNCALSEIASPAIDLARWTAAPYRPTPTIIEAARALYAEHSVEAIARHDAETLNLRVTSRRLEALVDDAMATRRKIICFVTGVPGAGKTLVGLNAATRHRRELEQPTHAVFLSGNGPLVAVLREALTRDDLARRKAAGTRVKKGQLAKSVKAFIQNVHVFRDEALHHPGPPADHVVIFDEAQRAWDLHQTATFMHIKKGQSGFAQSEPEFLIRYMDRHTDWAVVVCLVGGGQEINTGEAGIGAWLDALQEQFPDWHVHISPRLTESEYAAGEAVKRARALPNTHFEPDLHLSVPMRSFRAENVSAFVKALLDCAAEEARANFATLRDRYPIVLTRDLAVAKNWIRAQARGTERFGLVASSKAQRLKPHAINVRTEVNPVHWFLNDRDDTRSSYYLEDAATEFKVQGLELDWVCLSWDADLRFTPKGWAFHSFEGKRWKQIHKCEKRAYLRNAYRVLLTRARQGMVIFVPLGDPTDLTRSPDFYDATFDYLRSVGMPVLN